MYFRPVFFDYERIFQEKTTSIAFYKGYKLIDELLYFIADNYAHYGEYGGYQENLDKVKDVGNKLGSQANYQRVFSKIERYIEKHRIQLTYNLPEHPEKHNGFDCGVDCILDILSFYGFNYKLNIQL